MKKFFELISYLMVFILLCLLIESIKTGYYEYQMREQEAIGKAVVIDE